MDLVRICHIVCMSSLQHANRVIGLLCILSVCTICWIYYNVSADYLFRFTNRRAYITNMQRWNELLNGSHEAVWPKTVDETDDRIQSQIRFMEYYASLPANRTMKLIHLVGRFNFEDAREGQDKFVVSDRCPIHECNITISDTFSHTADVLVISEMSYFNWLRYLPKPPHQLWIAQHWESPKHDRIQTWLVRKYINWTVSYRRDSTIAISYGKYAKTRKASNSEQDIDYSIGKTKQVAWLVSNCHAKNNRLEYAHELAKYIDVDIYGTCGRLKCNRTGPDSCHNRLVRDYRFFLAFENSNCKDYITEKLYHAALQHNVIPIVMGARREDYVALAPPGSYIDYRSFSGPQELAHYLNLLAADRKLYNSYFQWKKTWSMIGDRYWCRMCMMLHLRDEIGYFSWFEDYFLWWNSVCGTSHLYSSSSIALLYIAVAFLAISIMLR